MSWLHSQQTYDDYCYRPRELDVGELHGDVVVSVRQSVADVHQSTPLSTAISDCSAREAASFQRNTHLYPSLTRYRLEEEQTMSTDPCISANPKVPTLDHPSIATKNNPESHLDNPGSHLDNPAAVSAFAAPFQDSPLYFDVYGASRSMYTSCDGSKYHVHDGYYESKTEDMVPVTEGDKNVDNDGQRIHQLQHVDHQHDIWKSYAGKVGNLYEDEDEEEDLGEDREEVVAIVEPSPSRHSHHVDSTLPVIRVTEEFHPIEEHLSISSAHPLIQVTYTHIHTHPHTHIHTYTYTHTHIYTHTYTYTHTHTHIYTHTHTTHTYTRIHTYTHTYIHTYTHKH